MWAKSILIVDDEQITREGVKKTLEQWSSGRSQILSAASGQEAIEVFERQTVHLLITDVSMPEMDGLMLIEQLRKRGKNPIVIILSGYSEFNYAQKAIRLGVTNYLLKPITKNKLIEAVEQGLDLEKNQERVEVIQKVVDDRLIKLNQENAQTRDPIKEAIRYVNENLDRPLSLREIADYVHLNPSYLSGLFKAQTNLTFSEYVTRSKLQNAKNLLITTDLPVSDIAEKIGYQTAKYFIKLFKEYEGITPSKYRKNQRENN